jgi:hypothetical protein
LLSFFLVDSLVNDDMLLLFPWLLFWYNSLTGSKCCVLDLTGLTIS